MLDNRAVTLEEKEMADGMDFSNLDQASPPRSYDHGRGDRVRIGVFLSSC